MVVEAVLGTLSLCFAALLATAVAHKVTVLARGTAPVQPLIKARGLEGKRAALALGASAALEVAIAVLLVFAPAWGLLAVATLMLFYAGELRRLSPEENCHCFGEWLAATRRAGAIRRNLVLSGVAATGGIASVAGLVETASVSQLTVGATLIVAAAVVPVSLQRKVGERGSAIG
jgi:hypothetical protein